MSRASTSCASTSRALLHLLLRLAPRLLPMPPKKNTVKKRAAGGIAKRFSGPLGSPVRNGEEVLPTVSAEPELPAETHSLWCLICRDGADGDVVLYQCDTCPRVMCSHCINIPADHLDAVRHINVVFLCLSCHSERTRRNPAPYFGFYSAKLPEKGGHPVLPDFLQLRGKFETASCSLLASTPLAIIHFIIGASDEVITPVPILSRYLEHFYPNGGYTYLEVVTRGSLNLSDILGPLDAFSRFFSNHSEQDSGWLFAGKIKGKFIAMSVSQVLSTVFAPYVSASQGRQHRVSRPPAIVFPATRFQPLVATNFLLAMAELVMVEQLDLQKSFLTLLSLSNRLGQHTDVIVMTTVDDAVNGTQLSVTTFARAHPQTKPWGISVPAQCPLCGSTTSWSEKVGVTASNETYRVKAPAQATVTNYVYTCTYVECGKRQGKSPHRFDIAKPPGCLVGAAKSKNSGWFQSPSTIFPPPPPVQSSPISPTSSTPTSSITKAKRSSESVEMTESTRKRARN
ncbi:hypothetical protein DFH29DRAFT_1006753 [Suillus ampliporus]|nr:hypothetical protein DFH29DRAFT_1006753 [Suillus ampliporus]